VIGIGLIGHGFAAKVFHRPLIESVKDFQIVGVLRRTQSSEPEATFPFVTSLEALFQLPSLKVVVITTPNHTHFEIARACLLAGLHVVVDKPFTVTTVEARELIAIAKGRGLILTVFHNRRYDGDFLTLQKIAADGTIGRTVSYESNFDRFRPELRSDAWREQAQPGSGVLYDLGPHLIDQALQLFGWPAGVFAQVRTERDGAVVDDAFEISLLYDHVSVLLRASMLAAFPRPRFLLQGTQGSYLKNGLDRQEELLKSGAHPLDPRWSPTANEDGIMRLKENGEVITREVPNPLGDYRWFYVDLLDAILDGKTPAIPPEAGLESVAIIEAALESSAKNVVVARARPQLTL
jgi:predicted dehydrogenase